MEKTSFKGITTERQARVNIALTDRLASLGIFTDAVNITVFLSPAELTELRDAINEVLEEDK